jgi:hypothetical protein
MTDNTPDNLPKHLRQREKQGLPPLPEKLYDFRYFLIYVWRSLGLPDPTPRQLEIAHYLQHGPRRKVIEAFRGIGKSWITSAYVVWRLMLDPQLKFLVVSASKNRSDNFTTFTRRLLTEIDVLRWLIPNDHQRDSTVQFDVAPATPDHSPSVKSVGITGQLTGTRADEIVVDDAEVANNSLTQSLRERLAESIKEFDSIIKPGGRITYLGTPQCEQSIYNLLPERGYQVRIWPARYPDNEQTTAYGDKLSQVVLQELAQGKAKTGDPTDPARFGHDDLLERELSYGRAGFNLQFMLDTRLSDANKYPLKLRDLIVMDADINFTGPENLTWGASPDLIQADLPCVGLNGDRYYRPQRLAEHWLEYTGSVLAIDPSGRGKDETSYAVAKVLNGFIFVPDAGGLTGGYSTETLEKLCRVARDNKVNKILIEANWGDGMFTALLQPVLTRIYPHCQVEEVRHSKQKELRIIDTLEPVISGHKLVMAASVIRKDFESTQSYPSEHAHKYQLFWQMSHITRDRGSLIHDDRLDALSMAVADCVNQISQDAERNVQARQERELLEELETWSGNARRPTTDKQLFIQALAQFNVSHSHVVGAGGFAYEGEGVACGDYDTPNGKTWIN